MRVFEEKCYLINLSLPTGQEMSFMTDRHAVNITGAFNVFLCPTSIKKKKKKLHQEGEDRKRPPAGDIKPLMGILCTRTLKSIYIIADRLSSNTDWSGFSIFFFSLCSLATDIL